MYNTDKEIDKTNLTNMEAGIEKKEAVQITAVMEGCMDEDVKVGSGVIKIGLAGSGVTNESGGNEELYPIQYRKLMKKVSPYVDSWMKRFAKKNGVAAYTTSHPACGAGEAQGIKESDLIVATKQNAHENGIEYAGHLEISSEPKNLGDKNLEIWFTRKGGPHTADFFILTTGGGITRSEKTTVEGGHAAFDISADWVKDALDEGLARRDAVDILVFQLKLGYAIAHKIAHKIGDVSVFKVFNGNRLDSESSRVNADVVNESVEIAKQEIEKGNWKKAFHH